MQVRYKLGLSPPGRFETLPKSPDVEVAETKYHEKPVDELHQGEQSKYSSIASEIVVK